MPLVAAVEEYARCRELLGDVPMMAAIQEFVRRNPGVQLGVKAKAEDNLSRIYRLFWPLADLPGCAWRSQAFGMEGRGSGPADHHVEGGSGQDGIASHRVDQ